MTNELYHHGVLGMHWGVRRYQNTNGTYTSAGRQKYGINNSRRSTNANPTLKTITNGKTSGNRQKKNSKKMSMAKKVAIGAAVVGGSILAVYGAKKASSFIKGKAIDKSRRISDAAFKRNRLKYKTYDQIMAANNYSPSSVKKYQPRVNRMMVQDSRNYIDNIYRNDELGDSTIKSLKYLASRR